jgi:hypothetical protein
MTIFHSIHEVQRICLQVFRCWIDVIYKPNLKRLEGDINEVLECIEGIRASGIYVTMSGCLGVSGNIDTHRVYVRSRCTYTCM